MAHTREPTAVEVDVEQSVLGLLLEGDETAWLVLDRIVAEDMIEPLHQRVVDAARRVLDVGNVPDPLTLAAAMASDAGLNEVGGAEYFRTIQRRVGRNRQIAADLCDALADQGQRRRLAHEIAKTEARLSDMATPVTTIASEHQGAVAALLDGAPRPDDPSDMYEITKAICERFEEREITKAKPLVPFGVAGLDDAIGGMAGGDLVVVGARPGMGKTAFGLAIADHVASLKMGVVFFSLEMKKGQIGERWLSMRAFRRDHKIPYNLIRLGKVNDGQQGILADVQREVSGVPLIIDERRGMTVGQIGARARSLAAKLARAGTPLGLAIVDHIQLIEGDGAYRGNKVAEVTEISRGLKLLAGSLDIPIIALSQLSRQVEQRDDKRPYMSDLRESGAIEQDADVVLLLHRPEYYARKNKPDGTDQAKLSKWEQALDRAKGFVTVAAAKVRQGEECEIKAKCEIAYNFVGEKID